MIVFNIKEKNVNCFWKICLFSEVLILLPCTKEIIIFIIEDKFKELIFKMSFAASQFSKGK